MRLELPIPVPGVDPPPRAGAPALQRSRVTWRPVDLGQSPDRPDSADAGNEEPARYYERHEAERAVALPGQNAAGQAAAGLDAAGQAAGQTAAGRDAAGQNPADKDPPRQGAPCLLIVSPLLPLPRSLPALVEEALASEPDFRLDWKWPLLTPRAGPWELVVQLCVGTSQATGHATGRVYVGLDAGSGAYLIVCIDRDPQKLAERQKEVLTLLAGTRLHRDRIPAAEAESAASPWAGDEDAPATSPSPGTGTGAPGALSTEIVPPQQPPPEIYLKEALFSYLTD